MELGCTLEQEQPPAFSVHSLCLLETHLPALTALELGHSIFTIPGEGIICLSKLKSLSFFGSDIYVDGELQVSLITELTHLNLTEATCFWGDAWVEALVTFTAWPALQVLKVQNCTLFDGRTNIDLATVLEMHVDHSNGLEVFGLPGQQSYVHTDFTLFHLPAGELSREGVCTCKSIAGLAVNLNVQHLPLNASRLEILLCAYPELACIKSLDLKYLFSTVTRSLSFLGDSFANLVNLSVPGLYPSGHAIDLQPLTCLTSLGFSNMDGPRPVHLIKLPCSLQAFVFTGLSLFLHSTEHNLDTLPCLTKVAFCLIDAPIGAISSYNGSRLAYPPAPIVFIVSQRRRLN